MKKFFAVVLALCMVLGMVPTAFAAENYTDINENDWYYDEVNYVAEKGLMDGITENTFAPDQYTTRAEVVVALYRLEGSPAPTCPNPFPDVEVVDGDTDEAIVWASCVDLVGGYPDGTFRPDEHITREQLATLLYRYYEYKGYDLSASVELPFDDAAEVSTWAMTAMKWAVAEGLFGGVGANLVDPRGTAERSHVAALLYKALIGSHTVTFDANWSRGEDVAVSVADGETVTKPANPTRSGYSFGGWYTKSTGGTRFSFSTPITEDITLYAKWYVIHYCSYGNWTPNNDGTHSRSCSCGSTETADCTLNGFDACPDCGYSDGNYHISSAADLTAFASAVNAGDDFSGKTVVLDADIDLSGVTWTPIGNGTRDGSHYEGNAFKGTFNGNDCTISNVKTSLFGVVDGGTVKNVKLVADIDSSADSVGAAVAVLCGGGIVDGVEVSGTVKGAEGVGGVVGRVLVEGTVTNCTNSATVTQTGGNDAAGGIVGKAYYTETGKEMTISDCTNTGTVTSNYAAGGIVGFSAANMTGCTNSGIITSLFEAGGIIGEQTNYGEVSGNTNTANITANGKAGGIIGWIRYQDSQVNYPNNEVITVTGNTNSGTITAGNDASAQASAGGIVGLAYKQAVVTNNTNSAESISAGTFAAGIVGAIQEGDGLTVGDGKFVVTNNATTTTIDQITANCTDLYVYNNDPGNSDFATVEGNGEEFVAKIGETSYTSLQDAINAAQTDETVKLIDDLEIDSDVTITIASGKDVTLDLNGKTLDGKTDGTGNREMFLVKGTMNVTNGTVTMKHVGTDMEWTAMTTVFDVTAGGVLNLSEVAVTNLGGTAMAFCVHLNNWGEVTLNVTNSTIKSTYCAVRVFNSGPDKNNVTITDSTIHGDNRAIWVHNYTAADFGSSYDADAVNGRLNFNIFNDTNTITAGTDGTKVNPVYYGFTDTIYYDGNGNCVATSANSLASGLASGANVTLTEDITEEATATAPYGNNVGFVHNGGTLDGGGNAITVTGGNDTYAIMTYGGTMKNLTVDSGVRGIVLYAPTKDVIIEDVTINGPGYGINTAEHPTVDGIDLIVTNSTINGWSSFAGIASASFTECTFGANTTKFWEGQGYDSVYDRLVKPYVDTLFKDCVFKQKVYLDLSALGEGCQITLDQCTADGTLITADNYTTLLEAIELPTGKTLADCVIFQ